MIEVGRDLMMSSGIALLCSDKGIRIWVQRIMSRHCWVCHTTSPGNLCSVILTVKCFLMFRENLLCCILCTLPVVTTEERISLRCICNLASGILCTLMRSHGVFSSSASSVSALSISLCRQDSPVLLSTLWPFPISSCPCCPRKHWSEQELQVQSHQCWIEGKDHFF